MVEEKASPGKGLSVNYRMGSDLQKNERKWGEAARTEEREKLYPEWTKDREQFGFGGI